MNEILPCPMCGGKAAIDTDFYNGIEYRISCSNCGLRCVLQETAAEAINVWNERTATPAEASSQLPQVPKSACDGVPREIVEKMASSLEELISLYKRSGVWPTENKTMKLYESTLTSYRSWLEASRSQGEGK